LKFKEGTNKKNMRLNIYKLSFQALIFFIVIISSYFSINALSGNRFEYIVYGGYVFDNIPLRIDALSGWMILIINITMLTGSIYGMKYLKHYEKRKANLAMHYVLIPFFHISMLMVCIVQNFLAFLVVWELMAISSFLLVILEYWKKETINAGLNYMIQSHIGIIFLTIAFIWVISQTGSYDFKSIETFSAKMAPEMGILLFVILMIGFGFKAGFVPLHTWLPYAHPAAPSHVSGMMSGVIIKLGIFGILRTLLLIKGNYLIIGEIILLVSVLSGLYGVILAIVQHNLKKLLAYHSIENIGIIGIGIGIGTIGLGLKNDFLAVTGFTGGLLHILNHSLFKSMLFYGAGNVYQATGILNIDRLGGLIRTMPKTASMFLVASLAICGLPPFNGFISEFLIYSGLFAGLKSESFAFSLLILLVIIGLVMIGGLALFCFTKAFGIVFLGSARSEYSKEPKEAPIQMLLPQYLIAALILAIGLFPQYILKLLLNPVLLFLPQLSKNVTDVYFAKLSVLSSIGFTGFIIILLFSAIYFIRNRVQRKRVIEISQTWSCGYTAPTPRMQFTASSYTKTYSNIVKPLLKTNKTETEIISIFPIEAEYSYSFYDKMEYLLIDKNLKLLKKFLYKLDFLQNGRIQSYAMYGLFFIVLIILFTYMEYLSKFLFDFFR